MANKILVVDDEVSVRDLFRNTFSSTGYNVCSADLMDSSVSHLHMQAIVTLRGNLKTLRGV